MKLTGSNPSPEVEGSDPLPGTSNYFIGNNPSKWRTNIHQYAKVKLKEVYPGIDMVYYGNQSQLEYDFVVKPGADPKVIQLAYEGVNETEVVNGDLRLKTASGDVVFKVPVVYQEKEGRRKKLKGRYALAGNNRVGFEVPNYDSTETLVIDPTLDYSTHLGGSLSDIGLSIAVDSGGHAYAAGGTWSLDFPTTSGVYDTVGDSNNDEIYVTKLNATGTGLEYSTYLGGNNMEYGHGIAVDASGNAYVTGETWSVDFPTTPGAFQASGSGPSYCDLFVVRLNPTGTGLDYSTYLGGSESDTGTGIAVDSLGAAYVAGYTPSADFPTTPGALQTDQGGEDGFVAKLNPVGTGLVYSTYLGGSGDDRLRGVAVDSSGNAYVAGYTGSTNYPTTAGAYQTDQGSLDVMVTKLNPAGTGLVYSTYLGGVNAENCYGIAIDPPGNAYVAGIAGSNFPTTPGAYMTAGLFNVFVTKLNAAGTGLVFSTYVGGTGADTALGIAVNSSGEAYVTGHTGSTDYPTTAGAFQPVGIGDAFMTKLNATGTGLVYSTYLGGNGAEQGRGIAVDPLGGAYVTGYTQSTDFPTTAGAYQADQGSQDAFVTKFGGFDVTPTETNTPEPTGTPLDTATPAATHTPTATFTNSLTFTQTPSSTWTSTPSVTLSPTRTSTPTSTPTLSFSPTPTPTTTCSFTPTRTATPTSTSSSTPTCTSTPATERCDFLFLADNLFRTSEKSTTEVWIRLCQPGRLKLVLYNTAGEKIKVLRDDTFHDTQEVVEEWDGTNEHGEPVANGVYLIHFEGTFRADTRKLLVLR